MPTNNQSIPLNPLQLAKISAYANLSRPDYPGMYKFIADEMKAGNIPGIEGHGDRGSGLHISPVQHIHQPLACLVAVHIEIGSDGEHRADFQPRRSIGHRCVGQIEGQILEPLADAEHLGQRVAVGQNPGVKNSAVTSQFFTRSARELNRCSFQRRV